MKRRAFTLIELLTVIAIIALLIAIVLPVMGRAREYARATRCISNVKQLTVGLVYYESTHETFPYSIFMNNNANPPEGGYLGSSMYDITGWWWINYIMNQSKDDLTANPLLWCPSRRVGNSFFKFNVLVANYGVNQSVCKMQMGNEKQGEFIGSPLSSADMSLPSQTVLIFDSGYATINWRHVTDSPPEPLGKRIEERSYLPGLKMNQGRDLVPEQQDDALNGRHLSKTVNIGYVDGHAGRRQAEELFIEKTPEGYKNLSPLWIPKRK